MSTSPPSTSQIQDEDRTSYQSDQKIPEPNEIKSRLKASYDAIAPRYNTWTTDHSILRNKYLDKLLEYLLPARGAVDSSSDHDGTQRVGMKGTGRVYRVLELGCGAGVPVTERLVKFDFEHEGFGPGYAFHVVANDLSSTQVELGMGKLGGHLVSTTTDGRPIDLAEEQTGDGRSGGMIEWIQGDMTKLDFPDESLDAVIAMYSLIHLPREEQELMIRRIARWLKRPRPGPSSSSDSPPASTAAGTGAGIMLLNFGDEASEGDVMERWLGEDKGWMYWSAWGAEKTMEIIKEKENGLEVLVDKVVSELEEGVDVSFLWVIARRSC